MQLEQLRTIIIKKFGKPIGNHYDVIQLQDAIERDAGKRISTQTIKRFFGLIKSSSRPDPSTLDAFAGYLNFTSYKDFQTWLQLLNSNATSTENDWASEIVLHILKDIYPENLHEQGILQLVKNLFSLFERHPNLTSTIYPKLAESKFGRRYFFQQFVHYDALASHYGMGLEHYLLHESDKHSRLFALSMLCLRDFLTCNDSGCNYYYDKIKEYSLQEVNQYHPFLIGRYYASKLFSNANAGINSADYISEVNHLLLNNDYTCTDIYEGFPCVELVFAEGLIFTGYFEQAFQLLDDNKVKRYHHPVMMDDAFKNHLNILRSFSGLLAGKQSVAQTQKQLPALERAPVYFLCSNYSGLFMNILKAKCNIKPRVSVTKAEECLLNLGFKRLEFYVNH
jgi:hypothetical protein